MPDGKHKSRTLRRVFVKTPGKENKIQYKKRKPSKRECSECNQVLHGIPHMIQSKFKNLAKSKKQPQRPYAGKLCSSCMRKKIREQVM